MVLQMSLIPPYDRDDILLPSCINSVRDLRVSPSNSNLALFACLGKKLAVLRFQQFTQLLFWYFLHISSPVHLLCYLLQYREQQRHRFL